MSRNVRQFLMILLLLAASAFAEARELDTEHGRRLSQQREWSWLRGPRVASLLLDIQAPLPGRAASGGGVWGTITGVLADQLDLQAALDAKPDLGDANVWTAVNTFGSAAGAADSIAFNELAGCVTWEGSSADGIEGRLCVTNPTVIDKTWTLPNLTGTIALLESDNVWTGTNEFDAAFQVDGTALFTALATFGTAAAALDSVALNETAGCITWEGSSADGIEGRLCVTNPTVIDKTWTLPNLTLTIAGIDAVQTWTADQSFNSGDGSITLDASATISMPAAENRIDFGGSAGGSLGTRTNLTPDSMPFTTGSLANSIHVFDHADLGLFDFNNGPCGTAACTDPTLIVHSHNQATGEFISVQAGAIVGTMTKSLTESAATDVVRIGIAQETGRGGVIEYTVFARDAAAERQTVGAGAFRFAVQNVGGTETCTMSPAAPDQTNDGSITIVTSGTLTYAWTCTSAVADTVDLELNAVSSLTQTVLKVDYIVRVYGSGTVAAQ